MSASDSKSGDAIAFTEEEVRKVFNQYDADGEFSIRGHRGSIVFQLGVVAGFKQASGTILYSFLEFAGNGTIDRTELQLLAFNLGRLMNDLELEAAFTALDADGSGSIDFDELFQWLSSSEAGSHKGAAQAALRASLTRRMAMRRAKAMKGRLDAVRKSGGRAAKGTIDLDVAWSFGKRALAEAAGSDAIAMKVTVDGSGKTAQLQDTSAQEGERAVIQLFMKLHAGVTDADVAAVVGPLNTFMEQAIEAMKVDMEDLPVARATIVGPLPLPPSVGGGAASGIGAGDRCLALELFLDQDPIKPALQAFEEFAEMAGGGSSEGVGDLTQLVQRLVEHFEVNFASSQSLQELLGLAPASSSSSSSLVTIKGKLAKSVLSVFQEMALHALQEATSGSFDDSAGDPFTLIQHAMALDNLTMDAEGEDEERLAVAAAVALRELDDGDDFKPMKVMMRMLACEPLVGLRTTLMRGMATMLLPAFASEAAEALDEGGAMPEQYKELQYLLTGKPAGFASAADAQDESKDVTERAWRVFVWVLRWLIENASEVHSVRLAGRGLGVVAEIGGVSLPPLVQLAQNMVEKAVHSVDKPEGEEESLPGHLQGRTPVVLLAGADPALLDATMAWCAASGTEECDDAFEMYEDFSRRVVVLPSGNGAVVDVPSASTYPWRTALVEGNTAVLQKAMKEDFGLMELWVNDSGKLRHKARCICLGVLRASDVPELTAAGGGDGMPSKAAQMTGRVMSSLLQDWQEHMEVAAVVDSDAKKQRLQPCAAVLVHEDVPVAAAAKEGAASALKDALDLPQGVEELRVIFANVGSGSGILYGMGQLVDAAIAEHAATMGVFGPEAER